MIWLARFDALLAELALLRVCKDNNKKKARTILLIGDDLGAIAELYGSADDDYITF